MDAAQSMLKTANLPNTFWEDAVATACYLQNRLPTTTLSSQTPFVKWSGIKPDLSHLKIFGSTAYSYVPDATRNKLEEWATKQVGYGDRFGKKGYRLYNPIPCKFQFSRSCIFYETSIFSPPPQDTSHKPPYHNSENLTPLLTPEIPIPPQPSSKPIPTHIPPNSSIQRYQSAPPKPKFIQCTSTRLKAKAHKSLSPHPTLSLNTIPKKARTKPTVHNFSDCLIPQLKSSMPLLDDDAGTKFKM